jgi:hypothetical protein
MRSLVVLNKPFSLAYYYSYLFMLCSFVWIDLTHTNLRYMVYPVKPKTYRGSESTRFSVGNLKAGSRHPERKHWDAIR